MCGKMLAELTADALSRHGWEDKQPCKLECLFVAAAWCDEVRLFLRGSLELHSPCKVPQFMEVVIGVWLSDCFCDANLIA